MNIVVKLYIFLKMISLKVKFVEFYLKEKDNKLKILRTLNLKDETNYMDEMYIYGFIKKIVKHIEII